MALRWMQRREEPNHISTLFWEECPKETCSLLALGPGTADGAYVNRLTWETRPLSLPPMEAQGGILADDMGLGKTLTVIALIVRSSSLRGLKP